MLIISLYNSKDIAIPTLLSHSTISNFYQNTSLFFFFEIGRKYVSIIVNIISNNTVLQSDLLWIFVSIRRLLQLIVCIRGLKAPSQKHNSFFFSFLPSPLLNLQTIKAHLFSRFTPSPQKICFNMHLSPKNWIFQWTPMILRTFIINPIPSFKSN